MGSHRHAMQLASHGARDMYVQGMLNHQERMANVKSTLQIDEPKKAFGGGKYRTPRAAPQPKHASDEYTEVRQAFKRILTSKASVSNQMEPWKMELGKQLSRNRVAKEDQHMKMEHAREIQHLHRRINQSHSLAERRKNKNDATLYPALLLRKSSSTPPGELWRQAAAAKSASPRGTPRGGVGSRSATSLHERPASARARTGGTSPRTARPARAAAASAAAKPPSRPQSARARKPGESVAAPLAPRGGAAGGAPPDATLPEAALGEPKDQYGAMREVVLHRIVEARLYREVDLRRFLKQVLSKNKQLDQTKLQAVVRDVEREFFLAA